MKNKQRLLQSSYYHQLNLRCIYAQLGQRLKYLDLLHENAIR